MAVHHQFGRGVAWMAIGNWTEQAVNFAVFVVLARVLGAESFGLLAMASVFVVLAEFLVRESVSEWLIAAQDPRPADLNAAFFLLITLGGALAAGLWFASEAIARAYGTADVADLVRLLAVTVLLIAPTAVPVALLRRRMQFRLLALRAIAGVVAGGAVGIGMALAGYGVWSLAGQRIAQVAVNVALAWAGTGWAPGLALRGADWRGIGGFGSKVVGLRAAELATVQAPVLVIGGLLGPVAAGLYSIAWRLVETLSFLIVTPLRMASQPAFADLARGRGRPGELLRDIAALTGPLAFPVFLGVAALAPQVLAVVFGANWVAAAPALRVLSLVGIAICIEKVQLSFGLALGQAGGLAAIAWLAAVLTFVTGWALAPQGIEAVAAGFALSVWVALALRLMMTARLGGLPARSLAAVHLLPAAAAAVMAAAVMAFARLPLDWPQPLVLLAGIALGATLYGLAAALVMRDRIALALALVGRGAKPPQNGHEPP